MKKLAFAIAAVLIAITPVLAQDIEKPATQCHSIEDMIAAKPPNLKFVAKLDGNKLAQFKARLAAGHHALPEPVDTVAILTDEDQALVLFFNEGCVQNYGLAPKDELSKYLDDDSI